MPYRGGVNILKTSMLGETHRKALVSKWPSAIINGVLDERGNPLHPGDLVRLPLCIRHGIGPDLDVPGTVMGCAVDKAGTPSVVVDALAWNGRRVESWRTWIVNGDFCCAIAEAEIPAIIDVLSAERIGIDSSRFICPDTETRERIARTWRQIMLSGVRTKAGVAIQPGDLVRLPRNVARNRGSQLHAAGLCLGYAVGLDGSSCLVVDAVGEDVPTLTRWRTWLARGTDVIPIDTHEAWRLESRYRPDGRPKQRHGG